MDGIFLLDFIKDLPVSLLNVYEYTSEYYGKYPALSIGYRPVFFPIIEAGFYSIFGISHLSAKMAVFFFLFAGMLFWFLLVQDIYDTPLALLSLLLWLTNPLIYQYSQQTMLEIPTISMCIICMYYLYKYEKIPSVAYSITLGIVVGLTLWTNQKSGYIIPLLFIYPLFKRNFKLLIARNTWISAIIILVFLIPLATVTIWLGDKNLEQSFGIQTTQEQSDDKAEKYNTLKWLSKFDPVKNISFIYHNHFSVPILILIFTGILISLIMRDSRSLIFIAGILSVYIFFTIIIIKIPRYPMNWIPFFSIFAAIGLQKSGEGIEKLFKIRMNLLKYAFYSLPVILQLSFFPDVSVGYASGYEKAAKYVVKKTESPVLFFDGYANGQFIFFIRANDPERQFVILRGSKLITSSSLIMGHKLKIHLADPQKIYKMFSDYSVQFVVVESNNVSNIKIHSELRAMLQDPSLFALHKAIPVDSNKKRLKTQTLLIYENLGYKEITQDKILHLRLPLVGKTINVKLTKLLNKHKEQVLKDTPK